jgi:hypothetical protein
VIPTSNLDGRQAKNRKRGDEILIVHDGAAGGDKVLRGHRKNSNRYAQVLKTVRET